MAVDIQLVQLNAQNFRWSPNAAIFKTAAAAAIDQEVIQRWAIWWVLSGYYLIIPVLWMEDKPCHAAPYQRGHSTIEPSSERSSVLNLNP